MRLTNASAFPGQFASWSCQVQSTIPLQFMWYLNRQLNFTTTGSHMNDTSSSSYMLNNVTYSDDGSNVRCSANASGLVVISNNVYLTGKLQYRGLYLSYKIDINNLYLWYYSCKFSAHTYDITERD